MHKIIYIMGRSSSGKDTIYKALKEYDSSLKPIVTYTTRPIRQGETDGENYHFVTEADYQKLYEDGKVIESRVYQTCHGPWRYFTADDGGIDLEHNDYLVIGTPKSYMSIVDYFGKERVYPVLIKLDDGERLQRALDREKKQANPKYEEMCRRFLADSSDFSEDRLREAGLNRIFDNTVLEKCLEDIKEYLNI